MTQRLIAACVALPAVLVLFVLAVFVPLPYVTYSPGPTLDVLGTQSDGDEIIQVNGEKTYRDDGELRMTTVEVTRRSTDLGLVRLMGEWFNTSDAVYPKAVVYPEDQSVEADQLDGQVQMVSSQDTAKAIALQELGYDVPQAVEVQGIVKGAPADGAFAVRDIFKKVDGKAITTSDDILDAINASDGKPVEFTVNRDGKDETFSVTPELTDGAYRVGVSIGLGYIFPFTVTVDISDSIGGPSAGLMFSLSIYDTLTPGSLTGGHVVAGTGEIESDGKVGAIGGIQQKIVGARRAGAELFLVPADNCVDAKGAHNGDMRLVKATTMHEARTAIEAWVKNPNANLPSCSDK